MRSIGIALAAVACTFLHPTAAEAAPAVPPPFPELQLPPQVLPGGLPAQIPHVLPGGLPAQIPHVLPGGVPAQIPQLQGLVPQLQGLVPQLQGLVPQLQGLVPQLQGLVPQLQAAVASCPTVEVAPNVRIPVCVEAIPQPPPGTVLPVPVFPVGPVPPSVDLRAGGLDGPVMNQQQTGVCYAFALGDVLDNSLRRQGRADVLSPLHVIASDSYEDMFGDKRPEPLTSERTWPYDPIEACKLKHGHDVCESTYGVATSSWQSDPVVVGARVRARVSGYATAQKATEIPRATAADGIVRALANGHAVLLNVGIDTDAWGFANVKDGRLRDYDVADRGAHAVAVVGYRTTAFGRELLIHNSWGTTWGQNGYVWITEAGLRKHFVSAYLVEAALGR